jgi:hypothetical protein
MVKNISPLLLNKDQKTSIGEIKKKSITKIEFTGIETNDLPQSPSRIKVLFFNDETDDKLKVEVEFFREGYQSILTTRPNKPFVLEFNCCKILELNVKLIDSASIYLHYQ